VKRAALLAVLVLAGCGGSAPAPRVAKPPHIPHVLAQAWESQASAVARSLAAGDGCTALQQANALRGSVQQSESRVPARLRSPLVAVVDALPARITCNPPPAPAPNPHPEHPPHPHPHPHPPPPDHGHHHGPHGGDRG